MRKLSLEGLGYSSRLPSWDLNPGSLSKDTSHRTQALFQVLSTAVCQAGKVPALVELMF